MRNIVNMVKSYALAEVICRGFCFSKKDWKIADKKDEKPMVVTKNGDSAQSKNLVKYKR